MKNTYLKIKNRKEFAKYVDLCLKAGYSWSDGTKDRVEDVWIKGTDIPFYVICSQSREGFKIDVWYIIDLDIEEQEELSLLKEYKFKPLKSKLK